MRTNISNSILFTEIMRVCIAIDKVDHTILAYVSFSPCIGFTFHWKIYLINIYTKQHYKHTKNLNFSVGSLKYYYNISFRLKKCKLSEINGVDLDNRRIWINSTVSYRKCEMQPAKSIHGICIFNNIVFFHCCSCWWWEKSVI